MNDRVTPATSTGLPFLFLAFHVGTAAIALVAGFVAIAARKGGRLHRRSGLVFVFAMVSTGIGSAGRNDVLHGDDRSARRNRRRQNDPCGLFARNAAACTSSLANVLRSIHRVRLVLSWPDEVHSRANPQRPLIVLVAVSPLVMLLYWMWRVRLTQNLRGLMTASPTA